MEELYSFKELCQKYNFNYEKVQKGTCAVKINFFKIRGIELEEVPTKFKRKKFFKIKDDSIFYQNWVSHPILPLELTKNGMVRNKDNKTIYHIFINKDGYQNVCGGLFIHRLLMQTFCPIPNDNEYVVDHINGIRSDNRLENLRWVFQKQNMEYKDINQTNINFELGRLIQKYGYTELLKKLQSL